MNNKRDIRWLQLSDLHMFEVTELGIFKEQLYDMFQKKVDFVVVTGDLHQYGKSYKLTLDFLIELVNELGIEKSDVIIVPGNHDAELTEERKNAIKNIDDNIENNEDVYIDKLNQLYSGFGKYKRFLRDFYGNIYNKYNLLENNIYNWRNKISLLCINTCLICDKNHYKPQIVDIRGLEKLQNTGLPSLALMHHDYYSICEQHRFYIKRCFKKLGISAVLSGHKHKIGKDSIEIDENIKIPNYCCGKSAKEPGDLWSDVGIIEYSWNQSDNVVKVIPYKWENKKLNPCFEFEDGNIHVREDNTVELKNKFHLIDNGGNVVELSQCASYQSNNDVDLDKFYKETQYKYLDGIVDQIRDSKHKYDTVVSIMEKITSYKNDYCNFEEVVNDIIKCNEKIALSVNGLQGTGKSTLMSLIYYTIKEKYNNDNIIPILIDLHYFDNYTGIKAKEILSKDLKEIDNIIKKYHNKKIILFFDGLDDYFRKTSNLEKIIYDYVLKSKLKNFVICIGSSDYLPESNDISKLRTYSKKAVYELKMRKTNKSDEDRITSIINGLIKIYDFSLNEDDIPSVKKIISEYTIYDIDFRTFLIILRTLENDKKHNNDYQSKGYFYNYYLNELEGSEKKLYDCAKSTYEYIILKRKNAFSHKNYTRIIHNNGITVDFLLAYYFVKSIMEYSENDSELKSILNVNFVFTVSVNKFIKNLILYKYKNEQKNIVERLKSAYKDASFSMRSQICYMMGRIEENIAKDEAKIFLSDEWETLHNKLFVNDILREKKLNLNIKVELVLFRTISLSLIWLNYNSNTESFLRCILLNERLNQINRGFHLQYYEDKTHINGVSLTYIDDNRISVNKTLDYLINNINRGFSSKRDFNKTVYLDIVTLYTIYQYRINSINIRKMYGEKLTKLADKILASPKIQSITVCDYINGIKNDLLVNPYRRVIEETYRLKNIQRTEWVERKVKDPESIADYRYGCYILAYLFLPDNIQQCVDYEISDIEEYSKYSKNIILKMLLVHDLEEIGIKDIVTKEESPKNIDEGDKFFKDNEYLCSFPYIYGLGNEKKFWNELNAKNSINAKIANDFGKIETFIQAYLYSKEGYNIEIDSWKNSTIKDLKTSLGKGIVQRLIENIVESDF